MMKLCPLPFEINTPSSSAAVQKILIFKAFVSFTAGVQFYPLVAEIAASYGDDIYNFETNPLRINYLSLHSFGVLYNPAEISLMNSITLPDITDIIGTLCKW